MKTYPDCNGDRVKTCPDCNGDGVVDKDTDNERQCPTCGGLGFVRDDDNDHEEVIETSRELPNSVTKCRRQSMKSILGASPLILVMPSAYAAAAPKGSACVTRTAWDATTLVCTENPVRTPGDRLRFCKAQQHDLTSETGRRAGFGDRSSRGKNARPSGHRSLNTNQCGSDARGPM
jgi:hypothetical protein